MQSGKVFYHHQWFITRQPIMGFMLFMDINGWNGCILRGSDIYFRIANVPDFAKFLAQT